MSNTNTIKPKKVLIAEYRCHSEFKIPRGIDLEAEGVKYHVYRNTLYITLPDGTDVEVECYGPDDSGFDEPNECVVEDDLDQEDEEDKVICNGCHAIMDANGHRTYALECGDFCKACMEKHSCQMCSPEEE